MLTYFFQSFQCCLNFVIFPIMLSSLIMDVSIRELFGEAGCHIVSLSYNFIAYKYFLGGLFMAIHRVMCIKYTKIRYNPHIQRQISKQLMVLEWITMIFWAGFNFMRVWMTNTNGMMAFCHGNSLEMDYILKQAQGKKLKK